MSIEDRINVFVGLLITVFIIVSMVQGCQNHKSLEKIEQIIAPNIETNIVVEVSE